jgi:hypothetical protein
MEDSQEDCSIGIVHLSSGVLAERFVGGDSAVPVAAEAAEGNPAMVTRTHTHEKEERGFRCTKKYSLFEKGVGTREQELGLDSRVARWIIQGESKTIPYC